MEGDEDGGVLDSALSHLERIVADATKYLGARERKQEWDEYVLGHGLFFNANQV